MCNKIFAPFFLGQKIFAPFPKIYLGPSPALLPAFLLFLFLKKKPNRRQSHTVVVPTLFPRFVKLCYQGKGSISIFLINASLLSFLLSFSLSFLLSFSLSLTLFADGTYKAYNTSCQEAPSDQGFWFRFCSRVITCLLGYCCDPEP